MESPRRMSSRYICCSFSRLSPWQRERRPISAQPFPSGRSFESTLRKTTLTAIGKRRRAREAAVQYHFWRDLQRGEAPEKIDEFWEFCPATPRVREFAQPLIEGMVAHLPEIDERIRRYCENYEFRRISAVDRNVLRLAIYEMLFRDDIPPVVSINEGIELAKTFGGAESGRFVNGILDRVRKDLNRPAREAVKKES